MTAPRRTAQCRSCRAHIRWVITTTGKRMPVDAQPTPPGAPVSYARAGQDDSDVYVYETTGGIWCCRLWPGPTETVNHLRDHIADGDHVPDGVIDDVLARTELDPDEIGRRTAASYAHREQMVHARAVLAARTANEGLT